MVCSIEPVWALILQVVVIFACQGARLCSELQGRDVPAPMGGALRHEGTRAQPFINCCKTRPRRWMPTRIFSSDAAPKLRRIS